MADPHGLIIGEVDLEPVRDLLGAPARTQRRPFGGACSCRSTGRPWTAHRRPFGLADRAGQPLLDVACAAARWRPASLSSDAWPRARPSTARPTLGIRACRRVWRRCGAARARSSMDDSGRSCERLSHARPLGSQQRDLLALSEREVAARQRLQIETAACRRRCGTRRCPTGCDAPTTRPLPRSE